MDGKETSRALPKFMYGNPADVAEAAEISELECRLCRAAAVTMQRAFCGHERNPQQKGFPVIGSRCRYFDERDAVMEVAK